MEENKDTNLEQNNQTQANIEQINETTEQISEPTEVQKSTHNYKLMGFIAISIIILTTGLVLLLIHDSKVDKISKGNNKQNKTQENIDENIENPLIINYDSNEELCILSDNQNDCNNKFSIEFKDGEVINVSGSKNDGYVLIRNKETNKLTLYKTKKYNLKELNNILYDSAKTYELITSKDNTINGIAITDKEYDYVKTEDDLYNTTKKCKYYDIKKEQFKYDDLCVEKIIVEDNQEYILGYKNEQYNYIERVKEYKRLYRDLYFINLNTNRTIINKNTEEYSNYEFKGDFIIIKGSLDSDKVYFTKDGEKLTSRISTRYIDDYNNIIYYYDDGELIKIDKTGNATKITKYNDYEVQQIIKKYLIVTYNYELYIIDLERQDKIKLADFNVGYLYHWTKSYYYDGTNNNSDLKEGIYILISYSDDIYNKEDIGQTYGPGEEIYFSTGSRKKEVKRIDYVTAD